MGRGTVVNAWRALILVGLLLFDPPAHGASLTRQCRRACRDEIAACVASGGERGPCSRQTRRRCQQQGLQVCLAAGESLGRTNSLSSLVSPSLAASAASASAISLTWSDTNTRVRSYSIQRSLDAASGFLAIASVGSGERAYLDNGLASTTTYFYRVQAIGRAGASSGYSNVANATTLVSGAPASTTTTIPPTTTTTTSITTTTTTLPDLIAPSFPTGLTASPVGCSQIYLAWTASTDTGGSGLEGYNVYVWRNYTWTFLKQVLAPATSTSDTGLTGSSTYYYAVSAVDGAGNQSVQSSWASATTSACATSTTTTTITTTTSTTSTTKPPTTTTTSTTTTTIPTTTTLSTTSTSTTSTTKPPTTTTTSTTTTTIPTTTTSSTSSTTSTTSTTVPADATLPSVPTGLTAAAVSCSQI